MDPHHGPDAGMVHRLIHQPVWQLAGIQLPVIGARAYPRDLLRKIEVVNDEAEIPFAIVFDRQHDTARFYDRRVEGRTVTFGTTGYALGDSDDPQKGRPLLYDRKTRSLWLPEEQGLDCVNGPLKGRRLPAAAFRPERSNWGDWKARRPFRPSSDACPICAWNRDRSPGAKTWGCAA